VKKRILETIKKAVPERMVFFILAYLIALNSLAKIPVYRNAFRATQGIYIERPVGQYVGHSYQTPSGDKHIAFDPLRRMNQQRTNQPRTNQQF
jgi:hypothetical protein